MLSIGRLGSGGADYYLRVVAGGAEDYYLAAGEEPGHWLGTGSDGLDLEGRVADADLRAVLDGRDPGDGAQLVRGPGGSTRRTPGFDLTFSAPKSVSLLGALGPEDVGAEVADAHHRAVEAAVAYLEEQAAFLRRGINGIERVAATGLVAASFTHCSSRAGDPALHSHVLVANMARDHEGRFGALDGRAIYRHAKTAGYLYQAELRHQLVESLGLAFDEVHHGAAEIAGVPAGVIRAFSTRRAEIERRMAERGDTSARAAEAAALDTRRAKDYGVSAERLAAEWHARAAELGFGQREIEACLYRAWSASRSPRDRAPARRAGLSGRPDRATSPASAAARSSGRSPSAPAHGGPARSASWPIASLPQSGSCCSPRERELPEARYTTPELLATERELLEGAIERQAEGAGLVDQPIVEAVLAAGPSCRPSRRRWCAA